MSGIPAIVQILIAFSLVVLATVFKVHMGLAAAGGGILLALWSGMEFTAISRTMINELLAADTLLLLALMTGIMAFSSAMKKSGAMETFSKAITILAPSKRLAMATAPLLIGTLPMPGGAILSAPLVESMDSDQEHGAGTLSAANYWFRHILELAWPLYPAFILTTSLSGISVFRLIELNLYAPPIIFALGLIFILPASGKNGKANHSLPSKRISFFSRLTAFIVGMAPLALVLGVYMLLATLWSLVSPSFALPDSSKTLIGRYAPVFMGLIAGSAYIGFGPAGFGSFRDCVNRSTLRLLAIIVGIRIFSVLIGTAQLAENAASELTSAGIPSIVAVAIIPFVAGLVTGVGFGYVGLAFPIILGLVPAGGSFPREAAVVLAGASGYVGMMLSPLHVCMVVSAEHFKAGLPATIRRFILPLGIFMVIALAYVTLLDSILR